LLPLPQPSSVTAKRVPNGATISPAYRARSADSARVTRYQGSWQMASKSEEPSSSYKYFEGSWRGERCRYSATSRAKSGNAVEPPTIAVMPARRT
jgi:hypothetical protein